MNYKWKYKSMNPLVQYDYEKAGIPKLLAKVMYNRGYSCEDYEIMNNNLFELANYYCDNIPGIHAVANRINRAFADKNTKVFVFSDYDTDGIMSAAIFNDYIVSLSKLNKNYHDDFVIHIPERKDGYGLNTDWCTEVITEKNKPENQDKNFLVITFDNGITKNLQIQYLRKNDIEVIITDHHEPDREIPSGIVVDPKKDDERLGEELCGAGIAWLICYDMYRLYSNNVTDCQDKNNILGKSLERCVGYSAIGTVGDMMNMTLFNIAMTKAGLKYLNDANTKNKCPIHALIKSFGNIIDVTSKTIGFNIAAAINACGQMGSASTALNLFLVKERQEEAAQDIIKYLNKSQDETKKAKSIINVELKNGIFDEDLICIYIMSDIPKGITGKLANHITSSTGKPAIVLVDNGSNELTGSGRCNNPSIDILEILKPLERQKIIKSAAGHKAACGVCFYKDKLTEARDTINENIVSKIEKGDVIVNPTQDLYIDDIIEVKDICYKQYKDLTFLPYSMNLYAPNLLLRGKIDKAKISSNNENNICYTVRDLITNETVDIWVWDKKAQEYKDNNPTKISIVGNLVRNFLRPGQITLDVVDLRFE